MVDEIDNLLKKSDNMNEHKEIDPKIIDDLNLDLDNKETK